MTNRTFQACFGVAVAALAAAYPSASKAQTSSCDRDCLKQLTDQFLQSLVAHNPTGLPLTTPYAATENDKPARLSMMGLWQTVTSVGNDRQYILDPVSEQAVFVGTLQEGARPAILLARLKIEDGKIAELELDVTRSKADTGEHFNPAGLATLPAVWQEMPSSAQQTSPDALAEVGKGAFDTSITMKFQPGCLHYEEGDKVGTMECAAPPTRPVDPNVRVPVVDTEDGIVASFGNVQGKMVGGGAFIPNSMMGDLLHLPKGARQYIVPMGATAEVVQLTKVIGGVVQGDQAYMFLEGPGARSPWVK